jgi:hypothetical protein
LDRELERVLRRVIEMCQETGPRNVEVSPQPT